VLQDTWAQDTFDHLVNNAGHGDFAMIADTAEAQFDALVNVHFKGVFFLTPGLPMSGGTGGLSPRVPALQPSNQPIPASRANIAAV
jgi:NAD(P)-dependent dehydrogenase (short-subunit alcohol dehydrogenase family)